MTTEQPTQPEPKLSLVSPYDERLLPFMQSIGLPPSTSEFTIKAKAGVDEPISIECKYYLLDDENKPFLDELGKTLLKDMKFVLVDQNQERTVNAIQ